MNQKNILIGCGAVLLFVGVNAAKLEYVRIQARIETTQAKIDKLADETGAMIDILGSSIEDVRKTIKSITDRFTKQLDDKAMQVSDELRGEIYRKSLEIVEHPKTAEPIKTFEPPKQPRIVMHSGYSCGPCNSWIATEKAKWEKAGWTIEIVKELDSKRGWPWFEIYERDGTQFQVDGPLTNDNFLAAKKLKQP